MLGLVVFLFDGDVVPAGLNAVLLVMPKSNLSSRLHRVPGRAGQDQQGGGIDYRPSRDYPRCLGSRCAMSDSAHLQHDLVAI